MTAGVWQTISDRTWNYGLKPIAIGVFFVLVALLWTFPLQHIMAYPFVFLFFAAIIGSTWFGGLIAGMFAIALSYVVVAFFFIPPLYSMTIGKDSRTYFVAFVTCGMASIVVSALRRRAEESIRTAKEDLETRVLERTAELERSNREILERERQLRILAESIPQQIWTADADGHIEYGNRDLLAYTGKRLDEIQGEDFFSIFHPSDARPFREQWETARSSLGNFELQARVRGANNSYRWFLVRGICQRDADGAVQRWHGVHVDIEDQQRAQQRFLAAHEDLSRSTRTASLAEMAASIAHELNQPLAALTTDAAACRRWLTAAPANLERAVAAAERIVHDTARASAVVSRVRSLFSKTDYVRQHTNLNQLLEDMADVFKEEARRHGIVVELNLDDRLPCVDVDPLQIRQVLVNLANNAIEAMTETGKGGVLVLASELNAREEIVVSVVDQGPGVFKEIFDQIFEPFVSTKQRGIGMGLAICRSIVEAHDGRIWASTSHQGSIFQFSLPTNGGLP